MSDAEKRVMFARYIEPHLTSIKSLAVRYTDRLQDADENYNYTLTQMYSYIHTYDPKKPLHTWLHIVTKRACFNQNKKRAAYQAGQTDIELCSNEALHQHGTANMVDAVFGTLADNLSDKIYDAIIHIDPYKLSPFLLYAQGMGIREIVKIEWEAGHIDRRNEELIKSRIYWARKQLQQILKEHGIKESSYTSDFRNK